MPMTPSVWLGRTQVNTDDAGFQFHQQVVGLANGNILVVFADDSDVSPGQGRDITGAIYDAEGALVRAPFQINTYFTVDEEQRPAIAATNDGGFIVVYEDDDGAGTSIRAERHNAAGDAVDFETIAAPDGTIISGKSSVAVDLADNSFLVSYAVRDGEEDTIRARKYDAAMTATSGEIIVRHDLDPTDSDFDGDPDLPATAALGDGSFVTVFQEQHNNGGFGMAGVHFRLAGPDGAQGALVTVTDNADGDGEYTPAVSALADGGFVVVWRENEVSGAADSDNIKARRYEADGTPRGGEIIVIDSGHDMREPDVIGLEDGSFFIAWLNNTMSRIDGRLYDAANGLTIGNTITIDDVGSPVGINLATTTDGRILATYQTLGEFGDVQVQILDPRTGPIVADAGDGQVTGRQEGSTIVGSDQSERLLGQDGDDVIQYVQDFTGLDNIDEIDGGGGSNTFEITTLGAKRIVDLDAGLFAVGDIETTGAVRATLANIQHVTVHGAQDMRGDGGANLLMATGDFANVLHGMGGGDVIFGGGGDDVLDGGAGADSLQGGGGVDTVSYASAGSGIQARLSTGVGAVGDAEGDVYDSIENVIGSAFDDVIVGDDAANNLLQGGDGADTLLGRGGADMIFGGAGDDLLDGGANADAMDGGAGNDTVSYSGATTQVEVRLTTGVGSLGHANFDSYGSIENVIGSAYADVIVGSNAVNNKLDGGAGNDTMIGNSGNDILTGGAGKDMMLGGANNDAFVFAFAADSAVGANRDTIWDFEDLGENDSIVLTGFAGTLAYVGQAAFTAANQVRATQSGLDVLVEINTTGPGGAESEILLANTALAQIDASDFFL